MYRLPWGLPFEHLIGEEQRIDVPRSCALVIQANYFGRATDARSVIALNSATGKAFHANRRAGSRPSQASSLALVLPAGTTGSKVTTEGYGSQLTMSGLS
jgi:hypothetical protein